MAVREDVMGLSHIAASKTGRVQVTRTAKLFLGDWRRPESGRIQRVGDLVVPVASRKDARDAVRIARTALGAWSATTPYLRGQILYRFAEMLEARTSSLALELVAADRAVGHQLTLAEAETLVGAAVDRVVHYSGWSDKLGHLTGSVNSVSAPFLSVTAPTPGGVVVTIPKATTPASALAGLIEAVCAPLAAGCTIVAVLPLAAFAALVSVTEALATSDLPAGTVSVLTYLDAEVPTTLAAHTDVDCFDAEGLDEGLTTRCLELAAEALTRVRHAGSNPASTARLRWSTEARTVWLPVAL